MDNNFIGHPWRPLKYEAVYLHELADGFKAERGIRNWMDIYNTGPRHSILASRAPAEAYGAGRQVSRADMIVRRRWVPYRPFHTGSRFSVKARAPSSWSSEE